MTRSTFRRVIRSSARTAAFFTLLGGLAACITKPDAKETDNDYDKWYFHCRLHDQVWCEGPFRRERDAKKAAWEHEFWLHMAQNTARVDHEPCGSP